MNFLSYLIPFAVALGLLVLVHELGHYLVARRCGVKVLRFSIGMGRPLVCWKVGPDQTEWALAAIPLGGFVRMLDEREAPVAEAEKARAFNRQSVWRRFAIVLAGPTANFLLAILLYWVLMVSGVQELRPRLGEVAPGSAAASAGLIRGDEVKSVAGEPVRSWDELRWVVLDHAFDEGSLELRVVQPDGSEAMRFVELGGLKLDERQGDPLGQLGLAPWRPHLPARIGAVVDGGAGAQAGLRVGDEILAVDGKPVDDWLGFVAQVRDAGGRPLELRINRDGSELSLSAVPRKENVGGAKIGRLGVAVAQPEGAGLDEMFVEVRDAPLAAVAHAVSKTWSTSVMTLQMLGRMVIGDISWSNLSGPLTIADYAGQSAHLGWTYYLNFIALVSISLGVLNLLPIPVLDGGHLLYYTIEIIKGSPVPERVMEIGQQIGMALLFMLMAFALYNDLQRLFSS